MAYVFTGSTTRVLYAREAVYGAPNIASTPRAVPLTRENMRNAIRYFQSQQLSDKRQVLDVIKGNEDPSGDLICEMTQKIFPALLWQTLGGLQSNAGAVTTHTIFGTKLGVTGSGGNGSVSSQISFTAERQIAVGSTTIDRFFPIVGCHIPRATLNFPTSDVITGTFRVLGRQDQALSGTTVRGSSLFTNDATAVTDPGEVYSSFQASVRFLDKTDTAPTNANSTLFELWLSEMSLDINLNMREDGYRLGSAFRYAAPESRRNLTGTLRMWLLDADAAGPDATASTGIEIYEKYYLQGNTNTAQLFVTSTWDANNDWNLSLGAIKIADLGGGGGGIGVVTEGESVIDMPFPFAVIQSSKGRTLNAPSGNLTRGVNSEETEIQFVWRNAENGLTY